MFKKSIKHLKSTKYLALMAIFIALKIVTGSFFVPVGENLRVYFTFLFTVLEASILGPIPALISGCISDLLGFMIHSSGPFFPGYTLSSMLGAFIYACFLYDTQITILKIAGAKLVVNLFVNVFLGSLWSTVLFSKGFIFYAGKSLVKNITLLPFEIFAIFLLFSALMPLLEKKNFVPKQNSRKIPWF